MNKDIFAKNLSNAAHFLFSGASRRAQLAMVELEQKTPDIQAVLAFIDKGANPTEARADGTTILALAIASGSLPVVKALIDKGADANETAAIGDATALMKAVFCIGSAPDTGIVQYLIDKGANINSRDKQGYTALMLAAAYGAPEVVTILLNAGANIAAKNCYGETPAMMAQNFAHSGQLISSYLKSNAKRSLNQHRETEKLLRAQEEALAAAASAVKPAPAPKQQPGQ